MLKINLFFLKIGLLFVGKILKKCLIICSVKVIFLKLFLCFEKVFTNVFININFSIECLLTIK